MLLQAGKKIPYLVQISNGTTAGLGYLEVVRNAYEQISSQQVCL